MQLSRKSPPPTPALCPPPSSAETQRNIVSEHWLETASYCYSDSLSYNAALNTKTLTTATLCIQNVADKQCP